MPQAARISSVSMCSLMAQPVSRGRYMYRASAVEVQNAGQVEPTLLGLDVSDVANPDLVGRTRSGQIGQAVGGNGLVVVAVGRTDPEPAFGASTEALLAH